MLKKTFIVMLMVVSVLMVYQTKAAETEVFRVAVASNFNSTLKQLRTDFRKKSGLNFTISQASSGKLYAQIMHGAPYDIFLSADEASADLLKKNGMASDTFEYAQGQLVFISNDKHDAGCADSLLKAVSEHAGRELAIANPKIAPYGLASKEVLERMGLWNVSRPAMLMGENILQTYQYVSAGGVAAAFIAKSLLTVRLSEQYCIWSVPQKWYHPVRQKLAVINKTSVKPAVKAFVSYIRSADAKKIIKKNGYLVH
ncbi:MAG: molybdate ABC transporter substrate-binding protein [Gammaproteobacteria bacterium]|nr:molybdate ABC transporter substrate-binding protein [Gammaproteobacteria bacterium]